MTIEQRIRIYLNVRSVLQFKTKQYDLSRFLFVTSKHNTKLLLNIILKKIKWNTLITNLKVETSTGNIMNWYLGFTAVCWAIWLLIWLAMLLDKTAYQWLCSKSIGNLSPEPVATILMYVEMFSYKDEYLPTPYLFCIFPVVNL